MHLLHPTSLLRVSFGSNWVLKTKTSSYDNSRMLFDNTDFNFAHFAHFNFAHFEIEEWFRLIWVKLQISWFGLQISKSGIYKMLVSSMDFIFAHFVFEGSFEQIFKKSRNDPLVIDLKISILVIISQIIVFDFVHFEYEKVFWNIN